MASAFHKLIKKTLEPARLARSFFNVNVSGFYRVLGKTEKALNLDRFARNILADKKGWRVTTARCYNNLAKAHYDLEDYETAIEHFESARKIFKEKNKLTYVALCDANIGHAFLELEQFEKARDHYLSAIDIFEKLNQKEYAANIKVALADVYSNRGQYEKAVDLNRSAKSILEKKRGWEYETANCDLSLAKIHTHHDWYDKAIDPYLSARKIFINLDKKLEAAKCDMDLAVNHLRLGQNELAIESFKSAESIFLNLGQEIEVAEGKLTTARIFYDLFQIDKAIELVESARETFDSNGLFTQVALCDIEASRIHSNLGNFEKAIELNQSAKEILESGQLKVHKKYPTENATISCEYNAANIYYRTGQHDKALKHYENVLETLKERGSNDEITHCLFNIACVNLHLNRPERALKLLENGRTAYANKGSIKDFELCCLNLAATHHILGNREKALSYFQRVADSEDSLIRAKSLFGSGKLYWEKENTQQAKSYLESAIREIENVRDATSQEDLRTSFIGTVFDFFYMMIELSIETKDYKSALEYVERLKSRSLAEMLANRDMLPQEATAEEKLKFKQLRSKIRTCSNLLNKAKNADRIRILSDELNQLESDYENIVTNLKTKDPGFNPDFKTTTTYSEIANLIPDDETAIIEFFPMDDKVVAFIVKKGQEVDNCTVIIDDYNRFQIKEAITELLNRYNSYQQSSGSKKVEAKKIWEDHLEGLLRQLRDKLFARIQPRLNGIKKIVMIPYSDLHFVPLHAMFSNDNGHRRYLIDDYLVTYAPSSQILKLCMQRQRKNHGKAVLAHANPKFGNNRLKYSQDEIIAISELFNESEIISSATKSDIIHGGKSANFFHYAGHAHRRALVLHSEKDANKKEEFLLEDIFECLHLPAADLVTLSACETGMILPKGVDEHFGISSGLMNAGAATVISSLWAVSDTSTSLLMRKMYELVNQGTGKAAALRQAQLWLKDSDNKIAHREMMNKYGAIMNKYDQQRGFTVSSSDWQKSVTDDFCSPYHWAGFMCSGVY